MAGFANLIWVDLEWAGPPQPALDAFQSRSSMMTPLGSRTWKARSPHSSDLSGIVTVTPSALSRASSPSRSSTTKARISPPA